MGLPLLLRSILPFGLMGLMLSAFFSAILSTADSCLIAASGNILTDIIQKIKPGKISDKKLLFYSKILTLIIGIVAVGIALEMEDVLELMLYSYAIMVSGLLVPVIALLVFKKPNKTAALTSMITGGTTTLALTVLEVAIPFGLAPNVFGLTISVFSYLIIHYSNQYKYQKNEI
jgi:SSS family solute:Na+ symporter